MKIKDFMTKKVVAVHKEMTVKEFVRFVEEHKITGAPVADESGNVIGVVSTTDVIKQSHYVTRDVAHCEDSYEVDPSSGLVEVHKYYTEELFETQIGELMTKDVISISPDASLKEAVDIFIKTPVHRILVMDGKKLVGIISTKDTIKALAKA
ncbi:MAG: CBS domain-containing protein [Gammaproteobacteria bacterium]|nr:MAG: CBS domain-containing protein [Gammaproteobacteria bacterium]